jgi:hypothetical protein
VSVLDALSVEVGHEKLGTLDEGRSSKLTA